MNDQLEQLLRRHWPHAPRMRDAAGGVTDGSLDAELLAAYIEGRLSPDQRAFCELRLSNGGHDYETFLLLSVMQAAGADSNQLDLDPAAAQPARTTSVETTQLPSPTTNSKTGWAAFSIAAMLGLVATTLFAFSQGQNGQLQSQVAKLEFDQKTQQVDMAIEQQLQTFSQGLWVGTPTTATLQRKTGSTKSFGEDGSASHEWGVAQDLVKSFDTVTMSAEQSLALAERQIKLRMTAQAQQNLDAASELQTSATHRNAQACLLLLKAVDSKPEQADQFRKQAIEILVALTTEQPQQSSAWFNLANAYQAQARMLRIRGRDDSSIRQKCIEAWNQFLTTEVTPTQRAIGEAQRDEVSR